MAQGSFIIWTKVRQPKPLLKTIEQMEPGGYFWNKVEHTFDMVGRWMQRLAWSRVPMDTGALRRSIVLSVDRRGGDTSVEMRTDMEYAASVEEGFIRHVTTSPRVAAWALAHGLPAGAVYESIRLHDHPPRPFFYNSADEGFAKLERDLGAVLSKWVRHY